MEEDNPLHRSGDATPLRTDSPVSLSIVASFLQFLNSVEAAPGTDAEGLEVAAQCLSEVFGLYTPQRDPPIRVLPLVQIFKAAGLDLDPAAAEAAGLTARSSTTTMSGSDSGTLPPGHDAAAAPPSSATTTAPAGASAREPSAHDSAPSLNESLLEQFKEGLDLAGYFEGTTRDTPEYSNKLNEAKAVLEDAVKKVKFLDGRPKWSATHSEDTLALAEAFKTQGNATMTARRYHDAIQLYTLAISLCSNNAIFYANRAAALTQVSKFDEAIADCEVAIKLDPRYSKAYSRMGMVYFAQNRLQEAIEKGFLKAFEIDPGSTSIQENLRAAQQKLAEQQKSRKQQQEQQRSGHHQEQPGDSQTSGTFSASGGSMNMPPEIANLLPGIINMAAQFGSQAQGMFSSSASQSESNESSESTSGGSHSDSGPTSHNGDERQAYQDGHFGGGFGNFNVTVDGQQLPPQFAGMMQSVFQQMFGGGVPGQTGPSTGTGTPPPDEAGWVPPGTNANHGSRPDTPRAE